MWAEAQRVIGTIQDDERLYEALKDLGTALTQAEQWTEAERVIGTIPGSSWQAEPLKDLATLMARTDNLEHLLHLIQRSWHQVESRKEALTFFSIAYAVISYKPEVGKAFFDAFIWVNTFLDG